MQPKISQIVLYRVSPTDSPELRSIYVDTLPAIVVRVWSDTCVNMKVNIAGPVDVWKTSVISGDQPGEWSHAE